LILVDLSVWFDSFKFNGVDTPQTNRLDERLDSEPIAIGDLMLTEVLQGFRKDSDLERARDVLTSLEVVDIADWKTSIQAAKHFRALRKLGVTVRKTIDTLIATQCIESGSRLLHRGRDFEAFEKYLGLRSVI
jgi:predicted nucleic acid-binding protein